MGPYPKSKIGSTDHFFPGVCDMKLKITIPALIISFLFLGSLGAPRVFALEMGTVVGEGAKPCTEFLKAKGRKQNNYMIWVHGYFTAYNAIAPDITHLLGDKNWPWVLERLRAHCEADPKQYFNEAMVALTTELHPDGIKLGDPNCKSTQKK